MWFVVWCVWCSFLKPSCITLCFELVVLRSDFTYGVLTFGACLVVSLYKHNALANLFVIMYRLGYCPSQYISVYFLCKCPEIFGGWGPRSPENHPNQLRKTVGLPSLLLVEKKSGLGAFWGIRKLQPSNHIRILWYYRCL